MKRIFLAFVFILCLSFQSSAWCPTVTLSGVTSGGASTAYCTASTTCNTPPEQCDQVCEDFDGSNDCNGESADFCQTTWSDTTTNVTFTWNGSNSASNLCGGTVSTYAVRIQPTANGAAGYALKSFSGALDTAYTQFYLTIDAEDLDDTEYCGVVHWLQNGGLSYPGHIRILQSGANLILSLRYHNGGYVSANGSTALSLDTMYRITVYHDDATNTITVNLNGSEEISVSDADHTDVSNISLGPKGNYTGDGSTMSYFIDNISVDDDTIPSACN